MSEANDTLNTPEKPTSSGLSSNIREYPRARYISWTHAIESNLKKIFQHSIPWIWMHDLSRCAISSYDIPRLLGCCIGSLLLSSEINLNVCYPNGDPQPLVIPISCSPLSPFYPTLHPLREACRRGSCSWSRAASHLNSHRPGALVAFLALFFFFFGFKLPRSFLGFLSVSWWIVNTSKARQHGSPNLASSRLTVSRLSGGYVASRSATPLSKLRSRIRRNLLSATMNSLVDFLLPKEPCFRHKSSCTTSF